MAAFDGVPSKAACQKQPDAGEPCHHPTAADSSRHGSLRPAQPTAASPAAGGEALPRVKTSSKERRRRKDQHWQAQQPSKDARQEQHSDGLFPSTSVSDQNVPGLVRHCDAPAVGVEAPCPLSSSSHTAGQPQDSPHALAQQSEQQVCEADTVDEQRQASVSATPPAAVHMQLDGGRGSELLAGVAGGAPCFGSCNSCSACQEQAARDVDHAVEGSRDSSSSQTSSAGPAQGPLLASSGAGRAGRAAGIAPYQRLQGRQSPSRDIAQLWAESGRRRPQAGYDRVPSRFATALWHGPADSAECALLSSPHRPSPPGPATQSSSRPGSPADSSACSEGSSGSARASQDGGRGGMPGNPSQYGLPYNFGGGAVMLLPWQDPSPSAGLVMPAQHSLPQSPQNVDPAAGRAGRRTLAPSRGFGPSRSLPVMPGGGSGYLGSASLPPASSLHYHAPCGAGLPYQGMHHCSAGTASSFGEHMAAPLGAQAVPAGPQQWHYGGPPGWAEPRLAPQPYFTRHVPAHQARQFVPRSQRRNQRSRYWQPDERVAQWQQQRQAEQSWQDSMAAHAPSAVSPLPGVAAFGTVDSSVSTVCSPVALSGVLHPTTPLGGALLSPSASLLAGDLRVPESAVEAPDLERFLAAATPQVVPTATGLQDVRMADLWRWYEQPSIVGCEFTTLGGPRGPATAHYLPYLSAVQLFAPAGSNDASAGARPSCTAGDSSGAGQLLSYPDGLDSWPRHMRPLFQWGEAANMRDRVPLHCRLHDLCGDDGERHALLATCITDLHPLSWLAVAWYPLYCVPEAPLTARFLTFHTLASLWEAASQAADKRRLHLQQLAAAAAAEAQRQRQAAQAAAATHDECNPRLGDPVTPPTAPPESSGRASYKSMLEVGLPAAASPAPGGGAGATETLTPTAVCSFPSSPTCSDTATRLTMASSQPFSVEDTSSSSCGCCKLPRSRLGAGAGRPGAAPCSSCGSIVGCPSDPPTSVAASSATLSAALSEAGDGGDAVPVPVAGLLWYTTCGDENWVEALVAAEVAPDLCPTAGSALVDGSRVVGCWRDTAVLARPYPLAKGGPLAWDIQQEEMAQCADRLVTGSGMLALRQVGSASLWQDVAQLPASLLGISCPDYDFFCSRSARYSWSSNPLLH